VYDANVTDMPVQPRGGRGESREVVELKALRGRQPELAEAVDLHLDLLELTRRVQSRIPLPSFEMNASVMEWHQAQRRPVLRFEDIPVEVSDLRLMVRQTAEVLDRRGALEPEGYREVSALARDATLLTLARTWYEGGQAGPEPAHSSPESLSEPVAQTLALAMRPYLSRCAEAIRQSPHLPVWTHPECPLCGGEADFSILTTTGDRQLVCSRCGLPWAFDPVACPYCPNRDRAAISSFSTSDGRYRVTGCNVCRRYLKVADERRLGRPVLLVMDGVATLPLDAAAIQRGYRG
jgi:hypothetical protein